MKTVFFASIVFLFISACSETKKTMNSVSTNGQADHKPLFDGKTMSGWRTYQNKPADSWTVKNGSLYCKEITPEKQHWGHLLVYRRISYILFKWPGVSNY
jgi:hypothetical protein